MRFVQPIWLVLLIPLVIGLVFTWGQVHGMVKARKRFAFILRGLLAGLVIFALSGPEAYRPNQGICTVFLIDRSDSISDADRKQQESFVDTAMQNLKPEDQAAVIAFGAEAVIESSPSGRRPLGRILSKVDASASDLAGALRLASAVFPDGKATRVVVLSDGNETTGDLVGAAQVASADGIPIDYVALGSKRKKGEVLVSALEVPETSREGQPFEMKAIIESTGNQEGILEVDRDGVVIKSMAVKLTDGLNSIVIPDTVAQTGFRRYRVALKAAGDQDNRNNLGVGFVNIKGKPRVLVLQENTKDQSLVTALAKNSIVADLATPAGIPSRPEQIQNYDAILFNDIQALHFAPSQMKLIASAIKDSGIGFAMVGGENSFLPGGWYGTPIAEALPVDLNIRQRKSFAAASVLIMADASGSMGMVEDGFQKIRLAGKAAEETVKLMSPMDRVGVAGSTDGIEFVAPMQANTNKEAIIAQIQKLSVGGGGIYIRPSMEKAYEVLSKEPSKVRHFILLADGADSDEQDGAIPIALNMNLQKITTSVVAIGDGKDVAFLKKLAAAGGGRFYLANRANQLPAIFTQDAAVMSRSAIEEGAFIPKIVSNDETVRGAVSGGVPPLLAYCLSDTRSLSRVIMRSQKDDPILATWQYGLGTSLAFTSDAQARWASRWVGWNGFGTFWSQVVRSISRRTTRNKYDVAVKNLGGKGLLQVTATDSLGNPINSSEAKVRISRPDGTENEVTINQVGPGKYEGQFPADRLGSYIVTVAESDGKGGSLVSSSGFSVPYPPEYRTVGPNKPLMAQVATLTKGQEITKPEQAFRALALPGASITELWPFVVLLAALLLPLDVASRRISIPFREMLQQVTARFRSDKAAKIETQAEVVGRLQSAKKRVRDTQTVAPATPNQPVQPNSAPAAKEPVAAPAKPNAPTASTLLESKRRRNKQG